MPTTEPKSAMARPRRGLRLRQLRHDLPRPPDEGVDTFGQPAETPPPEPNQPAPVVLVPSTKPEPVNIGTPTLTATPTTPDTTDSGETEQHRLDRLYPVGPDTRVDGRYLYTILRSGRQPTEDEWREC